MKVLFREIRAGDAAAVSARLDANPILVGAIAKAPPAKDDGQSTLQVAIKSGQFEVAHLLLDSGAYVHFMDQSATNAWNTDAFQGRDSGTGHPVLQTLSALPCSAAGLASTGRYRASRHASRS
jgi:ankyrin repeat protein